MNRTALAFVRAGMAPTQDPLIGFGLSGAFSAPGVPAIHHPSGDLVLTSDSTERTDVSRLFLRIKDVRKSIRISSDPERPLARGRPANEFVQHSWPERLRKKHTLDDVAGVRRETAGEISITTPGDRTRRDIGVVFSTAGAAAFFFFFFFFFFFLFFFVFFFGVRSWTRAVSGRVVKAAAWRNTSNVAMELLGMAKKSPFYAGHLPAIFPEDAASGRHLPCA